MPMIRWDDWPSAWTDTKRRPSRSQWKIDGVWYAFDRDYDETTGRVTRIEYPDAGEELDIGFDYTQSGWLKGVYRPGVSATPLLWRVKHRNP